MISSYRLAYTDSLFTAFRPRGAAARWNSEGVIIVYTAEHPALAAMEILAGWEAYLSLADYHLFRCRFDEAVVNDAPRDLDVFEKGATRVAGDAWAGERRSVVLRVPSVVVPESTNYLLNPGHPEFAVVIEITPLGRFSFDERIQRLLTHDHRKRRARREKD